METSKILDSQITASSFQPPNEPAQARLGHSGSWCPKTAKNVIFNKQGMTFMNAFVY